MNKSVYSVVLSDRVVSEIDRLAYAKGMNRSGMINRILAEYLSLSTPEMRISDIFEELSKRLFTGEGFRMLAPPTSKVLSLSSVLSYKYNPTVRYTVELYRVSDGCAGELRVSMRTRNEALIASMLDFYRLWTGIERKYGYNGREVCTGDLFKREIKVRQSPLCRQGESSSEAYMIAEYILLFDGALKSYFARRETAVYTLDEAYRAYLLRNGEVL